jgi:hypothetical protein
MTQGQQEYLTVRRGTALYSSKIMHNIHGMANRYM